MVKNVQAGKILFAVDQQPYLQGYLPIVFLALYKNNGNTVGGGMPVLTGPGYVTKPCCLRWTRLRRRRRPPRC